MDRPACFHNEANSGVSARLFVRAIWTDYYDGPTAGFVQCEACSGVFFFQLVDWDSEQEVRVFALAPLSVVAFDEIHAELCRFYGQHVSPVWTLGWLSDEAARVAVGQKIAEFTAGALPQIVVAWRRSGNLVLQVRRLGADDVPLVPDWLGDWQSAAEAQPRDWFQFVGLVRG